MLNVIISTVNHTDGDSCIQNLKITLIYQHIYPSLFNKSVYFLEIQGIYWFNINIYTSGS